MTRSMPTGRPRLRRLVAIAAGSMMVLFGGFGPGPAAATGSASGSSAPAVEYCTIVVKRIHPRQPETTVVHRACADTPTAASLVDPKAIVPLVQLFEHANLDGRYVTITSYDPCDRYGYTLSDLRIANGQVDGISSYQVLNECWFSSTYHDTDLVNYCAGADGNVDYVGDQCNDHLYAMRIWGQ